MERKVLLRLTKYRIAVILEKISWTYGVEGGLCRFRNVVPFVEYYTKSELVDMLRSALNSI